MMSCNLILLITNQVGEAETEYSRIPLLIKQNVAGLYVSMDNLRFEIFMQVCQSAEN